MCGRFLLKTSPAEIAEHFALQSVPELEPRYNVAPTQDVPIVRARATGTRELVSARWGLVPFGGPGPGIGPLLINARSETADQKAPFRMCWGHRRCLVPADGFYEWRKLDGLRQPYLIDLGGDLFSFAGLWDEWRSEAGEPLLSFTILTTEASPRIAPIHDRMPVLLQPGRYDAWLNPGDGLVSLLRPFTGAGLRLTPVAPFVNSVKHDGPECIRVAPEPLELDLFS